jgi:hypothetical protein
VVGGDGVSVEGGVLGVLVDRGTVGGGLVGGEVEGGVGGVVGVVGDSVLLAGSVGLDVNRAAGSVLGGVGGIRTGSEVMAGISTPCCTSVSLPNTSSDEELELSSSDIPTSCPPESVQLCSEQSTCGPRVSKIACSGPESP